MRYALTGGLRVGTLRSMASPVSGSFAAALLVGGRSSRMGRDKALLEWKGRSLWREQARKLSELSPARLLLSCREEQGLDAGSEHAETILDPPGNPGPLGAIARCLEVAGMPLLVLAVDMPDMTAVFLRGLLSEWGGQESGLVGRSKYGFEPLAAIYPQRALLLLRDQIAIQNYRMQSALNILVEEGIMRVREVSQAELPLFRNANTPEEYAAWKTSAPQASP
jgi:molybdopterin-guanine dinucleotide biosynthesis protein A